MQDSGLNLVVDARFSSFDAVSFRLKPTAKVSKSNRKKLREHMQRLDSWGFARGLTLDHFHLEADHVAIRANDDTYFGLYDDATLSVSCADTRVDSMRLRRIDEMITNILSRYRKYGHIRGDFEVTIFFHVVVKNANLKRFIRAGLASVQSSFLRRKLGPESKVVGLFLRLEGELAIALAGGDDMDFSARVHKYHKGVPNAIFTKAIKLQERLSRN